MCSSCWVLRSKSQQRKAWCQLWNRTIISIFLRGIATVLLVHNGWPVIGWIHGIACSLYSHPDLSLQLVLTPDQSLQLVLTPRLQPSACTHTQTTACNFSSHPTRIIICSACQHTQARFLVFGLFQTTREVSSVRTSPWFLWQCGDITKRQLQSLRQEHRCHIRFSRLPSWRKSEALHAGAGELCKRFLFTEQVCKSMTIATRQLSAFQPTLPSV